MSDYITEYGQLTDIPKRPYTGYIWKSDQRYPEVLDGTKDVTVTAEENPFIVEALLFDEGANISVMVKHTGSYLIKEFDLKALPKKAKKVPKEYFSHRLDGVKKMKFKQIWLPEEDENCKGMEVLKLNATVFTGFSN